MWFIFALLSALFAGLTSIFAKIGLQDIDSNLATAIRTLVVLIMAWLMVWWTHSGQNLADISPKTWLFLILSGLATGVSWLCYFYALKIGNVSQVVPIDKLSIIITLIFAFIFLHEPFTFKSFCACLLLGLGTYLLAS